MPTSTTDLHYTGTTATVSTGFLACYCTASANVTFTSGATGAGNTADSSGTAESVPAILSRSSTIAISGGTFTGGNNSGDRPAPALTSYHDASVTISGGAFAASAPSSGGGSPAALVVAPSAGAISGGTFTGPAAASGSGSPGGAALVLELTTNFTISGGTFSGGAGYGGGAQGNCLGISLAAGKRLTISGGTFTGPFVADLASGASIYVYSSVSISAPVRPTTGGTYTASIDGMGNTTYS